MPSYLSRLLAPPEFVDTEEHGPSITQCNLSFLELLLAEYGRRKPIDPTFGTVRPCAPY